MEEDLVFCSNEFSDGKWKSWCRLCAKADGNFINVLSGKFSESINENTLKFDQDLQQVLLQFFRIHIKEDDKLSQIICMECHGILLSIFEFRERVNKVQHMYDELKNMPDKSSSRLRMLLESYGLYKDEFQISQNVNELPVENIFVADLAVISRPIKTVAKTDKISIDDGSDRKPNLFDPIGDENKDLGNAPFLSLSDRYSTDNDDVLLSELKKIGIRKRKDKTNTKRSKYSNDILNNSNNFCSICCQSFQRRNNYTVHMKQNHGLLLCTHCSSSFKTQLNLKHHMKEHRKIFNCQHCDQTFEKKSLVSSHMKTEHKELKNIASFVCESCGEALHTQKKLSKHMLTHTKAHSSYVCKECGKCIKNKSNYRKHLQIHGDKYICAECGKQLNTQANYNAHMLVHSNSTPHECDFCGRPFKRAKALKYHLIAHMGLRPYSCDFCEKTFSTGSSCRLHKKTMHPIELAALEATGAKTYTKNVPNFRELKAMARTTKNWAPLASKQNGYGNCKITKESNSDDVEME